MFKMALQSIPIYTPELLDYCYVYACLVCVMCDSS